MLFVTLVSVVGGSTADAQTSSTWLGAGGSGWSQAANWTALPLTTGTWNLNFSGTNQPISSNDIGTIQVGNLTFANDGSPGQSATFSLSGASLSLSNGSITTGSASGLARVGDTVGMNLSLNGATVVSTGVGHNLTISGNMSGVGASLLKSGPADLYLTGSNSFSGGTTISAGNVRTGSGGTSTDSNSFALGTGDVTVTSGGMLSIRNSSTVSNNLFISGTGATVGYTGGGPLAGSFGASGLTAVVSGTVTLAGSTSITSWGANGVSGSRLLLSGPVELGANTLAFTQCITGSARTFIESSGGIRGAGAVAVENGAAVYMTGSNSYSGGTVLSSGVIRTGSNGPSSDSNSYALGTGDVVVSGSGMLEVRNNSTVSNNLTISGVGSSASGMQAGSLNGSFGASNQTAVVSGTVTLAGDAIISTWASAGVGGSTLLLSGPIDLGANALTFRKVPQSATTFIEARGSIGGTGPVSVDGGAYVYLTGSNNYSGNTYITDGIVRTGSAGPNASFNNSALGTGRVVISGSSMLEVRNNSTVSNNLTISGVGSSASGMQAGSLNGSFGASNQTAVVSGTVTLAGDAIISTWASAGVTNSRLLLSGPVDLGANTLTFRKVPQSATTFIEAAGPIGGTGSVIVDGTATVYLNGANTYTGPTTVQSGTLGGNGTLTSVVTVQNGATLAPGNAADAVGTLGVDSLVLESGATAAMSISGTAVGLYDQVVALNSVTYGGSLAIDFTTNGFENFDVWQLFAAAEHTGHFSTVSATGAYGDLTFNYQDNGVWWATGGSLADGQSLAFFEKNNVFGGRFQAGQLVLVPEPSTIVAAGLGILLLGWRRWSSRRVRRPAAEAADVPGGLGA